jgi:catechol 2,3-dioxygenase-like lactoylglutathione lyase family enzyme
VTAFAGVDHLGLSVTDLDVSERFYTGVLGLDRLVDFGEVRVLIDRPSSFTLSLSRHDGVRPGPFSELTVGLDHLGLTAASREELEEWEDRFRAAGVPYTPIRDMPFGWHLNFRDPDGIALEFFVPNDVLTDSLREVRERDVPQEEIRARVEQVLAGEHLLISRRTGG